MSGRHEQVPGRRVGARWLVALAALFTLLISTLALNPADAASVTVKTQLSLTGLANADNPLGGSTIGIHPGDKVSITTAAVPTRGLDKLGLGDLLDGVLNTLVPIKSVADFSNFPGGKAKTTVEKAKTGVTPLTFTFPKEGTYTFTWSMKQVTLLGLVPIKLDGNALEKAGVKLNASNEYVGKIVVAKNPPKGGISVQLPGVSVAPSLPVVGQLPTLGVPGVNVPTIQAPSVPNLNPTKAPSSGSSSAPSSSTSSGPLFSYAPPGVSVPELVVPGGDGGAVDGGGGGGVLADGGYDGILPAGGDSLGSAKASGSAAASSDATVNAGGKDKTVDLASETGSPSSQVPVILAILAIIALALVAGTYARLFLLKKQV